MLCLARLGVFGFLKRQTVAGKPDAKESWDRFEEYDSLSLRYVKQVSRKSKEHRLEKYKSNILISEVPTLLKLRTGPMKRLKDNRDVPGARLGTLPKTFTCSKRERPSYILLARGRMGTPGCVH